jgi:DNA-directed RNA polymerase specialized sigma24 family protein
LEDRLRSVARRGAALPADEAVVGTVERRLALDAAARLGDTDAEVLRLLVWEQLPVTGIAAVLGIDPNAVRQRLHRAKANIGREYRRLRQPPVDIECGEGG